LRGESVYGIAWDFEAHTGRHWSCQEARREQWEEAKAKMPGLMKDLEANLQKLRRIVK
jgi:hypothetical protein